MSTIINSMSFLAFARTYGPKIQLGQFSNTDEKTGEVSTWKSIICTNADGVHTFLRFSQNLGELTSAELKAMKNDLQAVQLDSGNWTLCKEGSTWETIDLGI